MSRPTLVVPAAFLSLALLAPASSAQFMQRCNTGETSDDGLPCDWGVDLSADGRFVVFDVFGALIADDVNQQEDVYLKDFETGAVELVSVATDGTQGDGRSLDPRISDDGRFVVFESAASNLVAGDTNGKFDIFLRDRAEGTTTRISLAWDGSEPTHDCIRSDVAGDGSLIAFETESRLAADDGDWNVDVYAVHVATGALERVSVSVAGGDGDGDSRYAAVDATGTHVAFDSRSSLLIEHDTNGNSDVFVRNLATQVTHRVDLTADGKQSGGGAIRPSINADGMVIAFESQAADLVAGDTNGESDVFVRDRTAGTTERVSVASDGTQADNDSHVARISGDGAVVAFYTNAYNLLVSPQRSNHQVLVRDRAAGTTTLASETTLGRAGDQGTWDLGISSDGEFVGLFSEADDLIPRDVNRGVFRRDRFAPPDWGFVEDYGDGWPGTLGIPLLDAPVPPALGTTFTFDASNSLDKWTLGLLVIGATETSIPLAGGGTLLASPDLLEVVPVPPWGFTVSSDLPFDEQLAGLDVYLQMLELDPGAAGNFSCSAGLQVHLGR